MTVTKTRLGAVAGTVGTAGAVVVACAACCVSIPLVGPVLAWLGLSSLGAVTSDWYLPLAGVSALGLGVFLFVRHRRSANRLPTQSADGCGCGSSCKT